MNEEVFDTNGKLIGYVSSNFTNYSGYRIDPDQNEIYQVCFCDNYDDAVKGVKDAN